MSSTGDSSATWWIIGGALAFVLFILVIVFATGGSAKNGPFCPYVNDPNFNSNGCTDHSSDANCSASVTSGFTADTSKCEYRDPDTCTGLLRPSGCDCLFDSQCAIGYKCHIGTCTIDV